MQSELFFHFWFRSTLRVRDSDAAVWSARVFASTTASRDQTRTTKYLQLACTFIVGGMLGIALLGFFLFHLYLVSTNATTLEYMEKRGSHDKVARFASSFFFLSCQQVPTLSVVCFCCCS